ncbi:hypothetical protein FRX31_007410, partial [Thalictrum thalictroides]
MRATKTKWSVRETSNVLRAGPNCFICRFHKQDDHDRIINKQPWQILGHLVLLESFSTGHDFKTIQFHTMPLWISFSGLELEHYSTETVGMIATAAGRVAEVLPNGVIPRTAEGYRARVHVLVQFPLVEGTMVNTLTKGDVWISFNYNNLPPLFCVTCRYLGHNRHNCNYTATTQDFQVLMIGYQGNDAQNGQASGETATANGYDGQVAMEQMNTWPHEIATPQGPISHLGQASDANEPTLTEQAQLNDESPLPKSKQLIHMWTETGLLTNEEVNTWAHPPTTNQTLNQKLATENAPNSPSHIHSATNLHNLNHTIGALPNIPPPAADGGSNPTINRRRGRPPGATNKAPKTTKLHKEKSTMVPKSCGSISKKRKTIEIEEVIGDNIPYIPQHPSSPIVTQPNNPSMISATTSAFSMDFIRQLLQNPETASILVNDGIINPELLTLITSAPPPAKSPTSIFDGPYAVASDDENEIEIEGLNSNDAITNASDIHSELTHTVAVELITVNQEGITGINQSNDPLLYPTPSLYTE